MAIINDGTPGRIFANPYLQGFGFFMMELPWTLLGFQLIIHYVLCKVLVTQSRPTLSDPMDSSSPGFSAHGILQARALYWVAIPFSKGPFRSKD